MFAHQVIRICYIGGHEYFRTKGVANPSQDPVSGISSSTYMLISQGNHYYSVKYGSPASMTGTVDIKDAYGSKPVVDLP